MSAEQAAAVRTAMRKVERSVARFSRNDAADIMQEAMTRAVRHGVECDAEPWLKVVARRVATDRARRAREIPSEEIDLENASCSYARSPEDIVVANESANVIRKAINALPVRYRDALIAYAKEEDHAAVASYFGISPNATWSLLCRARARLRQELNRVGYAFGFIGFRLQHWIGEASTACAVACVAIGVALLAPTPQSAADIPEVSPSKATVSVSLPKRAPVRVSRATVEVTKPVVEKAEKVGKKVAEPVAVASYEIGACDPRGERLPVGVHVSILEDGQESVVADVVSQLPDEVKTLDTSTRC